MIDPNDIAKRLGDTVKGKVNTEPGYFGALQLLTQPLVAQVTKKLTRAGIQMMITDLLNKFFPRKK